MSYKNNNKKTWKSILGIFSIFAMMSISVIAMNPVAAPAGSGGTPGGGPAGGPFNIYSYWYDEYDLAGNATQGTGNASTTYFLNRTGGTGGGRDSGIYNSCSQALAQADARARAVGITNPQSRVVGIMWVAPPDNPTGYGFASKSPYYYDELNTWRNAGYPGLYARTQNISDLRSLVYSEADSQIDSMPGYPSFVQSICVALNQTEPAVPYNPSVNVQKFGGGTQAPTYNSRGQVTNDGFNGDQDSGYIRIEEDQNTTVRIIVSNDGDENLVNFRITDNNAGPPVTGLSCTFPGGMTGTTWAGPLAPGNRFGCTATLPAMGFGATHRDIISVAATGQNSRENVNDSDPWGADTPPWVPSLDVEKYSDGMETPKYNTKGALTNDGYAGDYDAGFERTTPVGTTPVLFTVSNDSNEPLIGIVVRDTTLAGDPITNLSCTFPGGTTGTRWNGPFIPTQRFNCTAELPAMGYDKRHRDEIVVEGTGRFTGRTITDTDKWGADTPLPPSVNIQKYSVDEPSNWAPQEGEEPTYDAEGNLTNDGFVGDWDTENKPLHPFKTEQIKFTISNDGAEPLRDIVVSDSTTDGAGVIKDLVCEFPDGSTGTEWAGLLPIGDQFECTGTLPEIGWLNNHTNTATVRAVGNTFGTEVTDTDDWNGNTPEEPSIDVEKWTDDSWVHMGKADPELMKSLQVPVEAPTPTDSASASPTASTSDSAVPTVTPVPDTTSPSASASETPVELEHIRPEFVGPKYDADGNVIEENYLGDWDSASRELDPRFEERIFFTVSNNGKETLKDIVVVDQTKAGTVGELKDIECTFPDDTKGVEWTGPFEPATQFECSGILPAIGWDAQHTNTVTVKAVGSVYETPVKDSDEWNGFTPERPKPAVDIEKWSLDDPNFDPSLILPEWIPAVVEEPVVETTPTPSVSESASPSADPSSTIPVVTTAPTSIDPSATASETSDPNATVIPDGVVLQSPTPAPSILRPTIDPQYKEFGPRYSELGALLKDGYTGDWDDDFKWLKAKKDEKIVFTVSNSGNENLLNIKVSDSLVKGVNELKNLECVFPDGTKGVEWDGPFIPADAFNCMADLPALGVDKEHVNTATVTAMGQRTGDELKDTDNWAGKTPFPSVNVEKYSANEAGPKFKENGDLVADNYEGDWDTGFKALDPNVTEKIKFTITNNGTEILTNVVVTDDLADGSGKIENLSCVLPDGSTGTKFTGDFLPGKKFHCTGTVPALGENAKHTDIAKVVAQGKDSEMEVSDTDQWSGATKPVADIHSIEAGGASSSMNQVMVYGGLATLLLGGTLIGFLVYRKKRKEEN